METATVLIIFIASLLLGLTGYSVYTSFGSASKNLRDPFEEHENSVALALKTQLVMQGVIHKR